MFTDKEILSFARQFLKNNKVNSFPKIRYYHESYFENNYSHLYAPAQNETFLKLCTVEKLHVLPAGVSDADTVGLLDLDFDFLCTNCFLQAQTTYDLWHKFFTSLYYWNSLQDSAFEEIAKPDVGVHVKNALNSRMSLQKNLKLLNNADLSFITMDSIHSGFLTILQSISCSAPEGYLQEKSALRGAQRALEDVFIVDFLNNPALPSFGEDHNYSYAMFAYALWYKAIYKGENVSNLACVIADEHFKNLDVVSIDLLPKKPLLEKSAFADFSSWAAAEIKNQFLLFAEIALSSWNTQLALQKESFENKEVLLAWDLKASESEAFVGEDCCLVFLHAADFSWRNDNWVVFTIPIGLLKDAKLCRSMHSLGEYEGVLTDELLETTVSFLSTMPSSNALHAARLSLQKN